MNLETVSDKQLHELEQLSRELLAVMRKAKLLDTPLAKLLYTMESQAGEVRRTRFDAQEFNVHRLLTTLLVGFIVSDLH